MRQTLLSLTALSLLVGCTTVNNRQGGLEPVDPFDAILGAATHPEGVKGIFTIEVRSTDRKGDWLYLNSEADMRDQRCLTIAIPPAVDSALRQALGGDPADVLRGRLVQATGTAKRVTIWLLANGVRTNSYYYQTHIIVEDPSRISFPEGFAKRSAAGQLPGVAHGGNNSRGIEYVDYVPTPREIKEQLEADGWKDVTIVHSFPDYLQGPIRALSLFDWHEGGVPEARPQSDPQVYGRILADRIEFLNLVLGTDGIVTAPLELPGGRRATTFHVAVKEHYVMIIWDPTQRDGYVWRSFIYKPDGTPVEMRFLMQRQDLARI